MTPPAFTTIVPATTRPTLQRFITEDPISLSGGDTNLYAYEGNSPTNFTDPSGNIPQALGAMCLGAISGAAMYTVINILAGPKVTVLGFIASAGGGCIGGLGIGLGLRALRALRAAKAAKAPLWSSTNTKSAVKNAYKHWTKHKGEFPEFQNAKQYAEAAKKVLF